MKILYLITKSNWGGAQRYVYDLATVFSEKGHEVVVASGGDGVLFERLRENGVRTIEVRSLVRDISFKKEWNTFKELLSLFSNETPDVVHLNSSKAGGLGALAAKIAGVPKIIFTVHGAPFREDRSWLSKRFIYILTWITCLLSDTVITVSKQDEADIGAMFFIRKKVTTIYLGLTYEPPKERRTPKGRVVRVLTVGELTKNKGHIYALHAIELLKESHIPIEYHIIGEGEERARLEEFIAYKQLSDVVTLHGYKNAQDILHEFDMYLLPSIKEGLPYVLVEAGKNALPTVATTTGGVPEIIRHETTGLLVPQKNALGMAHAIKRLVSDRRFARRLGQALHSHIVQNFSHTKMIVETAKEYGLIESKK